MMTPIERKDLARVRCAGKLYCYDINTLKSVVESDPRDPTTRTPYSDAFLDRLRTEHARITKKTIDPWIVAALRQVDALFSPVEDAIGYSERITEKKRTSLQSKLDAEITNFKNTLRDETIPAAFRMFIVFGDPSEPGPAPTMEQRLRAEVFRAEFG